MQTSGRIVFFGSSEICLEYLENLQSHFTIPLIITTPDQRGGRARKLLCPPVKKFAGTHHIPLLQPRGLRSPDIRRQISQYRADIAVVISYGKLIPRRMIQLFPFRMLNVHYSLLPAYRGAAPVQRAILNGETRTGVTIFEINPRMDAGDIYTQKPLSISSDDTSRSVFQSLCRISQSLLIDTIQNILQNSLKPTPQDHSLATYAPRIHKEEGYIDWNEDAGSIYNRFRAFTPWPSVSCQIRNRRFKLIDIIPSDTHHDKDPGTIIHLSVEGLLVACGNRSSLLILSFQPPGKKPMPPLSYNCGNPLPPRLH